MSNSRSFSQHSSIVNGQAHYKVTRTVTGPDGKTHTETVEMQGDDAVNMMQNLRAKDRSIPDFDRFGNQPFFDRARLTPSSQLEIRSNPSPRSVSPSSSSRGATKPTSTTTQNTDEFVKDALERHNDLRRRHGVEPLKLNNDLTQLAQRWANHLATTNTLAHSKTKYRNTNVGENLRCQSWPMTGKEMTDSWYNECSKYDYRNPTSASNTGHFTQVVWKGSQEVGFARAVGPSMTYAVAMYFPPGNYIGEFERNVFPPRS